MQIYANYGSHFEKKIIFDISSININTITSSVSMFCYKVEKVKHKAKDKYQATDKGD